MGRHVLFAGRMVRTKRLEAKNNRRGRSDVETRVGSSESYNRLKTRAVRNGKGGVKKGKQVSDR